MIFTMPWSPTCAYPHPFAGPAAGHHPVQNYLSYGAVDLLIWSVIGDLVNRFRQDTLKLPPMALVDGAAMLEDNEVPFTYLWPAALMPKPADWGAAHRSGEFHLPRPGARLRALACAARLPRRRRSANLRRVRVRRCRRPSRRHPHHLHGARKSRRARHRIGRLGASRRRHAPAERLLDRRLPARLVAPALPRRLPSWGRRNHRRRSPCRAAHGRGAFLRRSVLLGADRRGCRRGP